MTVDRDRLLDELRAELGDDRVLVEAELLELLGRDTWPLRLAQAVLGRPPTRPLAAVRPRSASEVASALRVLARARVAAVPRGGGSGVLGGAEAPSDAVVLD